MKLTREEHRVNAEDWIGASSEPLQPGELVDRAQLAEQLQYTNADAEDVGAIAQLIEEISSSTRLGPPVGDSRGGGRQWGRLSSTC